MTFKIVTPKTPEAVEQALQYIKVAGLSGDYFEFGVYTGWSLFQAWVSAQKLGLSEMNFIGMDSFEGLPELEDVDQGWEFNQGDYECSYAQAWTNLDDEGIDWSRVRLLKVWFDQLPRLLLPYGPVSVALIDCDLYHSTVPVLQFLKPRLQHECVLVFDDWYCFDGSPHKGQQLAFREFLVDNPEWLAVPLLEYDWHGKAYIMRRSTLQGIAENDLSYHTSRAECEPALA
jgi:O-methyltransferase